MMGAPRYLCVGTHHKTGTVWMRRVLHAIKDDQDIPISQCNEAKGFIKLIEDGPQFVVNWGSTFPFLLYELESACLFHIIRDPRDVLVSGMRYHRVAPLGNEKFLREPQEQWGGKNYQEYLNALPSDRERLLFEMENKHHETVQEMLQWPYGHPRAVDVKYEDLIRDEDCSIFRGMLAKFAIEGLDIDRAVKSYWDQSLFGGRSRDKMDDRQKGHISSGSGGQWRGALPRDVARIYADRYGEALRTLGYAKDDSWLDETQEVTASV